MSAICGIMSFQKKLIARDRIQSLVQKLDKWGPDHQKVISDEWVGLGQASLYTTPESIEKWDPHRKPTKDKFIVADCRLDNRNELMQRLSYNGELLSDAELILMAYEKWQDDCVLYLKGDFSFAIWDKRQQKLLCARDHLGIRPLFYRRNNNEFIFASHMCALFNPEEQLKINKNYLIDYIYLQGVPPENSTPYTDIHRISKGPV
ncbi:hypothetical protein [Caldalkalibacillus mannanilyticus]|uniref:hypothetical protein n=1 Tax=Caldalkalibacillus mannanilyticus TaxID=1418 RepID=UPI000469890A|nr:hypothetical protein [Caldalkalibacillus mannanilyticus]